MADYYRCPHCLKPLVIIKVQGEGHMDVSAECPESPGIYQTKTHNTMDALMDELENMPVRLTVIQGGIH